MTLQIVRQTAESLAVDIESMREHTRVDGDWDNSKLEAIAYAVQQTLERSTSIAMTPGTYQQTWDYWPDCQVLKPGRSPVTSITSLEVRGDDDQWVTVSMADYRFELVGQPARVYPTPGVTLPQPRSRTLGGIRLTFEAGVSPLPQRIRQGVLMGVDSAYEYRGDLTELNLSQNPIMRHFIASFEVPEFH